MIKQKKNKLIARKFHLFNAKNKILGRLATEIVKVLRGKDKSDFTPNIDGGDFVVVINSEKISVSGNKLSGKIYHRFSGYPGGITSTDLNKQMARDSRKIIEQAVYGMLPKNKLRKKMMNRLRIYKDVKHPYKIDVNH
jgi:large subunit ribosomal protein L13